MLPYGRQTIGDGDIEAVVKVLRSDWLTTGPMVSEFEQKFAQSTGAGQAVAVSSGTAALHLAMLAAGVGAGDEVIVPALTFVASANCVRYVGGDVVFADVRSDTLTIDVEDVARKISGRTRAIVVVDYAGQPADLDEILSLARQYDLIIVEDAAHSVGAEYRGRPVGSIADMTTFSFHPVKQMTTGEGGMVTTNDLRLDSKLRLFRNHGITTDHRQREEQGSFFYEMIELGFNYRITDFQCALGLAQMERLPEWLTRRREIAARYTSAFSESPHLKPLTMLHDRESAWHLYVVQLQLDTLSVDRSAIFSRLREAGLGVNVHYIPVYWHPYYEKLCNQQVYCPVTEDSYHKLLTLPLFPTMKDEEVQRVIDTVEDVLSQSSIGTGDGRSINSIEVR
ncbi:MAG: UDP-4-amino-4,6-dideoxy-N-acetyl-beta-L-altrosamine transaminase [Acidobacteria bacterium]|nr:UDP-4-amino-4,6-dideoxy-N-acetyl-beta-L-altrosamine transaminase [Acidobacteriota bacterium]